MVFVDSVIDLIHFKARVAVWPSVRLDETLLDCNCCVTSCVPSEYESMHPIDRHTTVRRFAPM
jgi:hypothetical protein